MLKLYNMMMEKDATMIEINPMVEALDPSGQKRGDKLCMHTSYILHVLTDNASRHAS